jgi:predicted RNA-binding protein YlqC (UPF0109 family)
MVEEGRDANTYGGEPVEVGGSPDIGLDGGAARSGHAELDQLAGTSAALKELLEYLAQRLVTNPDAVQVTESEEDNASVLELRVDKDDLGRVIGKQGRTAKSLRTILNAAASRVNRKVVLEIVED